MIAKQGYKGKDILKKIAQLWMEQKGNPKVLAIKYKGEHLIQTLYSLDVDTLRANLSVFKLSLKGNKKDMATRLAQAMIA